jgi:hypothetical protein
LNFPDSSPGIPLLQKLLDSASDTASLASQFAIWLLLCPDFSTEKERLQGLPICLETLRRDWFDGAQIKRLDSCFSLQEPRWPHTSVPKLLQLLFEAGAPVSGNDADGRNMIGCFMGSDGKMRYETSTLIEVLSVLIERGVGIDYTCPEGLTPSMYARYIGRWNEWRVALRRNNKNIEDVVKAEGNEWLLDDGWCEEWRRRRCGGDWYSLDSDDEEESEEEDDDSGPSDDDLDEEIKLMDGDEMTDEKGMTDDEEITDGEEIVHEGYQQSDS